MIDIYLDTADLNEMREARKNVLVKGVTTNPSLMRKAGVSDYEAYAKNVLDIVEGMPVSFEVIADDFKEMERQARKIASWGRNIYIKIPILNTEGTYSTKLLSILSREGIKCNVTAVFTLPQIYRIAHALEPTCNSIISIFAGRIADTMVDPVPLVREIVYISKTRPEIKILWASTREVLNIHHANDAGCHIITITPDLLNKYMAVRNKDLTEYSLETSKMFYNDAVAANYKL